MIGCTVEQLDDDGARNELAPPEVPRAFLALPREGDGLIGADGSLWTVVGVEHTEGAPPLSERQRAHLERVAELPSTNPMAAAAQVQLGHRPQCKIVVVSVGQRLERNDPK